MRDVARDVAQDVARTMRDVARTALPAIRLDDVLDPGDAVA
jgi:hypothetical protein